MADTVIGIVLLTRHGDRNTFFQDPKTYTGAHTLITPLGEQQEFETGSLIRSLYLNQSSPTFIDGISPSNSVFQPGQVVVRADAGDEGGVIFDSTIALLQGLFPATPLSNITLANGTTIFSPLGGYQYVPVETVEAHQDISLQGFTFCNTLNAHTIRFYRSDLFRAKAQESKAFLAQLQPFLNGIPATLENMWNVFDFVNVQSFHNATFAEDLPPTFLEQARDLANFHEHGVFTDREVDGIGNIAARTLLPSILNAFRRIENPFDPLKLHFSAISYKPFLSLFNMTGVNANGEIPPAIVNYAAAVVFEVLLPSFEDTPLPIEPLIRLKFKNGTDDSGFTTHPMLIKGRDGRVHEGDIPLSTFVGAFESAVVRDKLDWCRVCEQPVARGCDQLRCMLPEDLLECASCGPKTGMRLNWGKLGQLPGGLGGLGFGVVVAMFSIIVLLRMVWFGKARRLQEVQRGEIRSRQSQSETLDLPQKS